MGIRLFTATAAAAALVAPDARAAVRLNSDWQVTPRIGFATPSQPYTSEVAPYDTLGGTFLQDPSGLAGAPSSSTTCLAQVQHPFDEGVAIDFGCEAGALGSYDGAHGLLVASGSAGGRVDPASYVATPSGGGSPVQIDNPWIAGGNVYFELSYLDEVTFTSIGMPAGTPIDVIARMTHAPVLQSIAGIFPSFAWARMETGLGGVSHHDGGYSSFVPGGGTFIVTDRSESGAITIDDPNQVETTLQLEVGDTLYVAQHLYVGARSDAYLSSSPQHASVSDAAQLVLEPPADVGLVAFSGEQYAPEPNAASAALAGAAALLGVRRRRPR